MSEGTSQTPLLSCLSGINTHGGGGITIQQTDRCAVPSLLVLHLCVAILIYMFGLKQTICTILVKRCLFPTTQGSPGQAPSNIGSSYDDSTFQVRWRRRMFFVAETSRSALCVSTRRAKIGLKGGS